MTLVYFPSNTAQNNDPFPRELELFDRCSQLWSAVRRLAFTWSQQVPSEGAAQLEGLASELAQLPAASTDAVMQMAHAVEGEIARLRFRQAFPIVEELNADSLVPNAAHELPDRTLRSLQATALKASRLFQRGDPKAAALMATVERRLTCE